MARSDSSPRVARGSYGTRPGVVVLSLDPVTGKKRRNISFQSLGRLLPSAVDKLPGPVEFRGVVGRGKKATVVRLRKRWVGFGWADEGEADGSEPLLCLDETVGGLSR